VARARGDYEEARRHFQASYALKKEFSDPEGMAVALNHLGDIAILQSEEERAAELYAESLAIYQEINDRGGRAKSLQGLGRVAWARQDYEAARKRLAQALDMAYEIEFWPLVFSLLLDSGELLLQTNRSGLGFGLLALVQRHPHSDHETTARADQLLARWQEKVGNAPFGDAKVHKALLQGKALDLETAVGQLQTALAEPIPARTLAPTLEQPLVEPLTDRELEVLDLMAQGYTNREIAEELVIALGTVKWYASQIYGKLDVSNRTEAANRAREIGLLP
jgi:ATP/maltotriose-dependent transcriptional regulator MalT